MTVILTAAGTLLVCAAIALCGLWLSERNRRKKAETFSRSLEGILAHAISAEREARCAQEMICQGVDTLTQKLDTLADGAPLDAEKQKDLIENLNGLLSYSMSQAMDAVKPQQYGGDDD